MVIVRFRYGFEWNNFSIDNDSTSNHSDCNTDNKCKLINTSRYESKGEETDYKKRRKKKKAIWKSYFIGTTSSTSTISVTDTTTPQDTTTLPPALNITGSVIIMENSSLPLLTPTIITGNLTVETGGILTLVTDQSTAIAVQSGCVTADPGSILQINLTNANTSTIDVLVQDSNCPTLSFGGVTINKQYGGSGCPIGVQT